MVVRLFDHMSEKLILHEANLKTLKRGSGVSNDRSFALKDWMDPPRGGLLRPRPGLGSSSRSSWRSSLLLQRRPPTTALRRAGAIP